MITTTQGVLLLSLILTITAFGPLCNNFTRPSAKTFPVTSAIGTKVAFVGDFGLSASRAVLVLEMVKNWGADPLVILGDFDYVNSPSRWQEMLDSTLGPDFPILAVGGNHDVPAWSGYRSGILANMAASGLDQYCTGSLGVDMVCSYKGVMFFLNQVGTQGSTGTYVSSMERALAANQGAPWKFCGWHKNQKRYQTGDKSDETGYPIMDTCRRYGAVVATAHEHSYSRSVLMSSFASATIVSPRQVNDLQLSFGESFVFVSGLGGNSIRSWVGGAQNNPWWAANAASNNGVNYAALLCTFSDDSAVCEERDIDGYVWDTFTIYPPVDLNAPVPPDTCSSPFFEIGTSEDLHEDASGLVLVDANVINLSESSQKIAFRFMDVQLSALDKISTAHFQIFGIKSTNGSVLITIRAEISTDSMEFGKNVPMKAISMRKVTETQVTWIENDGDIEWEDGEVWVSPNIQEILEEVVALPGWVKGNAITLVVEGIGGARHVYTRDSGDCLAPTLSIELVTQCN